MTVQRNTHSRPERLAADDERVTRAADAKAKIGIVRFDDLHDRITFRCEEILAHSWSVRTTEEGVQAQRAKPPRRQLRRSPDLAAVEDSLRVALATRVRLVGSERAGRIEIAYSSREELDRLAELITTRPR